MPRSDMKSQHRDMGSGIVSASYTDLGTRPVGHACTTWSRKCQYNKCKLRKPMVECIQTEGEAGMNDGKFYIEKLDKDTFY